jgi:FkbM family methyltransferase
VAENANPKQTLAPAPAEITIEGIIAAHGRFLSAIDAGQSIESAVRSGYGWDLEPFASEMLLSQIDQIVIRQLNDFASDREDPTIIDCGANIGVSVLNYKRRFPRARIVAFEPDPTLYEVLRRNLERNHAADVKAVLGAVWTRTGEAAFISNGTDGGTIVAAETPGAIRIRTVDLNDYLTEAIDLLKVDIEGGEYTLLPHILPRLVNVQNVIVECHIDQSTVTKFGDIVRGLRDAGFHVAFNTFGHWRDLVRQATVRPFNFQQYVAVYGWRSADHQRTQASSCLPYLDFTVLMHLYRGGESHQGPQAYQQSKRAALNASNLTHRVTLRGPFRPDTGHCWMLELSDDFPKGDNAEQPEKSNLVLLENGQPLGPPHVEHAYIRRYGAGRYSHWRDNLYFSASDNSNPNTNGHRYVIAWEIEKQ